MSGLQKEIQTAYKKKNLSFFSLIHEIRDDPMALTRRILGLAYDFLLNHRGSSMNLRF